jgi:hypothetical protein
MQGGAPVTPTVLACVLIAGCAVWIAWAVLMTSSNEPRCIDCGCPVPALDAAGRCADCIPTHTARLVALEVAYRRELCAGWIERRVGERRAEG